MLDGVVWSDAMMASAFPPGLGNYPAQLVDARVVRLSGHRLSDGDRRQLPIRRAIRRERRRQMFRRQAVDEGRDVLDGNDPTCRSRKLGVAVVELPYGRHFPERNFAQPRRQLLGHGVLMNIELDLRRGLDDLDAGQLFFHGSIHGSPNGLQGGDHGNQHDDDDQDVLLHLQTPSFQFTPFGD